MPQGTERKAGNVLSKNWKNAEEIKKKLKYSQISLKMSDSQLPHPSGRFYIASAGNGVTYLAQHWTLCHCCLQPCKWEENFPWAWFTKERRSMQFLWMEARLSCSEEINPPWYLILRVEHIMKHFVIRSNLKEFTGEASVSRVEIKWSIKTIWQYWRGKLCNINQANKKNLRLGRECWCSDQLQEVYLVNRSVYNMSCVPSIRCGFAGDTNGVVFVCFRWPPVQVQR